jgi:hypothetical protein
MNNKFKQYPNDLEYDFNTDNYIPHLANAVNNHSLSLCYKISRQRIAEVLLTPFEKMPDF